VKRVYRAASLLQVAHARNVLIAAGIRCEMRNLYLAGAAGDLPMMETWPQLYVEEADERNALGALERAASPSAEAPWICGDCDEQLEAQFTTCWRCGYERGGKASP
jgi:Putative prokaryotic signal transducing protein